jgi:hypothetical protein
VSEQAAVGPSPLSLKIKVQPCDGESCAAPQEHILNMPLEVVGEPVESALRHAQVFERASAASSATKQSGARPDDD